MSSEEWDRVQAELQFEIDAEAKRRAELSAKGPPQTMEELRTVILEYLQEYTDGWHCEECDAMIVVPYGELDDRWHPACADIDGPLERVPHRRDCIFTQDLLRIVFGPRTPVEAVASESLQERINRVKRKIKGTTRLLAELEQDQVDRAASKEGYEKLEFFPVRDKSGKRCFICFTPDELSKNVQLKTDPRARQAWMDREALGDEGEV